MTRILFFVGSPLTSTALFYRAGILAQHLDRERYEVKLTSVGDNYDDIGRTIELNGVPISIIGVAHYVVKNGVKIPLSSVQYLKEIFKTIIRARKIARDFRPDIIQTFSSLPVSLLTALFMKRKYTVAVDIDDLLVAQAKATAPSSLSLKLLELMELGIPRKMKYVSVNSTYLNKVYPDAVRIPNMIPVKEYMMALSDTEKQRIRAKYGIDDTTIVFVSTITLYHGHFELLDYISKYENTFLFVGGGEGENKLREEINRRGLERKIIVTGSLPHQEVIKILNVVHIGILPMWDTPVHQARHPLKLLEYLASGTCVVASNVGEVRHTLNKNNGILVDAGDMQALIREACNLKNPEKYSKEGLETVKQFDTSEIMQKWEEFYERISETV